MPSGRAYLYFAADLGRLSELARDESHREPQKALGAIVFAVAYVEGLTNELLHFARIDSQGWGEPSLQLLQRVALASELEGRDEHLQRKLRVIGTCLTGRQVEFGHQPWQDLGLLIRVRNGIIHHRTETHELEDVETEAGTLQRQTKLPADILGLVQRGVIEPPDPNVLTSSNTVLRSPQVAVWAHDVAMRVAATVFSWFPESWREAGPAWSVLHGDARAHLAAHNQERSP